MLNGLWLILLRRPIVAALISLEILIVLTLLSRFKFEKLWMTIDFLDVMIVDRDTMAFLLDVFPGLRWWIALAAAATAVVIAIAWRLDRYRVRFQAGLAAFSVSAAALVAVSLFWPTGLNEDFEGRSYVSKFARTGVEAIHELSSRGYLEAVARASAKAVTVADEFACHPAHKPPHIILLHDESSFDITVAPGVNVPVGYRQAFPVVRRQDAQASGGGRRRTKLVHRIQRAYGSLGSIVRPVCDRRHAHGRRTYLSRSAARVAAMRLRDV